MLPNSPPDVLMLLELMARVIADPKDRIAAIDLEIFLKFGSPEAEVEHIAAESSSREPSPVA
jgi:hypothetical protein